MDIFNVGLNARRLEQHFHLDKDFVMVRRILFHDLLMSTSSMTSGILDDYLRESQLSFPDFRCCKYFIVASEVSREKVVVKLIIPHHGMGVRILQFSFDHLRTLLH
jgi:hypothetical protein